MSNTFKHNTRFSSLLDDKQSKNTKEKLENKTYNNEFKSINFEKNRLEQVIKEHKNENAAIKNTIDNNVNKVFNTINDFPELVAPTKKTNDTNLNFLKVFNEESKTYSDTNPELDKLKPGYVLIKRNLKTNETIILSKALIDNPPKKKSEQELENELREKLANRYEERKQEYIDNWGYDEWEKMFRFPNYDYEYFDKLDELYYAEEDKSEESIDEEYSEDEY